MREIENPNGEPESSGAPHNVSQDRRMRRGIYLLPALLTVANLLCGYFAILATLKGSAADLDNAAKAIGLAILFDMLDGRVARATGTNSDFGKEFDALADIVSFGIAPAFLSFVWGMRGLLASSLPQAQLVYQLGWLVTFIFVTCCAWRLARFNVHGMAGGSSRYFAGLPTPASAGTIAAVVHAFWSPIQDWRISLLWLLLVLSLGLLMISTVRYAGFKDVSLRRRLPSVAVVLIALLIAAAFVYSELTLLVLASVYVLHGVVLQAMRFFRHRHASTPVSRPV